MKKRFLTFVIGLALVCLLALPAFAEDLTTTNTSVYLRGGPGVTYERLSVVPSGTQVTVVASDDGSGWTKIEYDGTQGYAVTRFLAVSYTSTYTEPGDYITSDRAILRSAPGTTNPMVMVLPKDETVTVSRISRGWASVEYEGAVGYVSIRSLFRVYEGGTTTVNFKTTGDVNMRSSPSANGKLILTVPRGATVAVSSVHSGWAAITYKEKTGYIYTKYMEGLSTAKTYKATKRVNMRAAASGDAEVLTIIPEGDKIQVIRTEGDWASILYQGQAGYVMIQYFSETT